MRTLEDLKDLVGRETFEHACRWAWATAAATGRVDSGPENEEAGMVPHDLADPVWYENDAPMLDRLRLAFDLYEAMPCYGNLMYVDHFFDDFDDTSKDLFWTRYRDWLGHSDDRLADPAAYSLWVDYYEAQDRVHEAWRRTIENASQRQLQRVVRMSGPVPWPSKAPLYAELAAEPQWHPALLDALKGSAFEVFGKIDRVEATLLLQGLCVPEDEEVRMLREKLAASEDDAGDGWSVNRWIAARRGSKSRGGESNP